jgi:long-chain acyl-CoA synthetase
MNLATRLTANASGAGPAIWWRGEVVTHADLARDAGAFAAGLAGLGVQPGDRVGIVSENTPWFVRAYLGALWAGCVAVPVNPLGTADEIVRELTGTGTRLAVVGATAAATVTTARAALGDITLVAVGDAAGVIADAASWEDVAAGEPPPVAERGADDAAVLVHTSGTSGPPRAAVLTHGNLVANIDQALGHPGARMVADDVVLAVLPLFHVFGLNSVMGLALAAGAQLVLVERFDPPAALALVRERGVTVLPGVPPMFGAWLGLPDAPADAFASVRLAISGAAPLPLEIQRAFTQRFGVDLHQGYGLTEAGPAVTADLVDRPPRPGTIGVPLPGVDVRLVDDQGGDVLEGDPGEIWVRGPNVFAGYWEDPEATARALTPEGWLRTGDVAVADGEGFLSIVDRSKDLVIVSGFNVYPAEVEEVLVAHPGVADAAVVGIPSADTGEAVKAFVVPVAGADLDPAELSAFCARSLARYKCPSEMEVVGALPRGLAGKLLRRELVDPGPS